MQLDLADRNALVTGGSRGIGYAIAKELWLEGANVAICGRDEAALNEAVSQIQGKQSQNILALKADVTDETAICTLINQTLTAFGSLDILINNAGRAQPGNFETLTDEMWRKDIELKLFSMIRCSRAVIPHMRERGGGRIININAIHGKMPDPAFMATSTNRAACMAFTKALSLELASSNILVNTVNVGYVRTPQWENIRLHRSPNTPMDEFLQDLAKREVPLGRFGQPEEVAGIVAFLASKKASYITGASIDVSGGMGKYL